MLPAYVINLDRRPDRWATISEQCSHLGIQVTRISAIDAEGIITAGHISAGEEACLQSHCAALQEFLKTRAPAALILEDDAELSSALPKVLRSTSWWPDDARLIKLDVVKEKHHLLGRIEGTNPAGNELRRIAMAHAGAAGYLIDRAAAELILSARQDMLMPIDLLLFHLVKSPYARLLKPLQAVPALVRHSGEGSDIAASRTKATQRIFRKRHRQLVGTWFERSWRMRTWCRWLVGRVQKVEVRFWA